MTNWASISLIPTEWRGPFLRMAENDVLRTRSRLTFEDRYDPREMFRIQIEWVAQKDELENVTEALSWEEKMARVPIVRTSRENEAIDSLAWQHAKYGELSWEAATLILGGGKGELNTIITGIEFDADLGRELGLMLPTFGSTATQPVSAETRGRKLSEAWPDWIAASVFEAMEGNISGSMTAADVHAVVANRLIAWGIEEIPISTARPAISKILKRLRADGQ